MCVVRVVWPGKEMIVLLYTYLELIYQGFSVQTFLKEYHDVFWEILYVFLSLCLAKKTISF